MPSGTRIEKLAALAITLTQQRLSVSEQFEILAKNGLRTEDIGWRKPSSGVSGQVTRIPTTQDGKLPESAK